jgi:pyroglutamyl-peptidase
MKRLLVTGFGPFPGMTRNPSAEIAPRVAASPRWRRMGVDASALVLETSYAAVGRELEPALRDGRFDAVLMIGVAGRARRVRIETRALNRARTLVPDASGRYPQASLAAAPGSRASLAAAARMKPLLRRAGVACERSQEAGGYLCNAAYFAALAQTVPVVFLHIPKPARATRLRRDAGKRPRLNPQERVVAAFVEVGVQLLAQARRTS